MTPFEKKELLTRYVDLEAHRNDVKHPVFGYTPSKVRATLENPNVDEAYYKALKQQLAVKGVTFLATFKTLHAIFYFLERGLPLEQAKRKARYVLDKEDKIHVDMRKHFLTSGFVDPAHISFFQ